MRLPKSDQPIRVKYYADVRYRVFFSIDQTPFKFHAAKGQFQLACLRCAHPITWRRDEDHLHCGPRCRSETSNWQLEQFGREFIPSRPQRLGGSMTVFPMGHLERLTAQWPLFEQQLTLLQLKSDVEETVGIIEAYLETLTPVYSTFGGFANSEVNKRLAQYSKDYWPTLHA